MSKTKTKTKTKSTPQGVAPAPAKGLGKDIAAQRRRQNAADRREREKLEASQKQAARQRLLGSRAGQPTDADRLLAHIVNTVTGPQTAYLRAMGFDQDVVSHAGGQYGAGQTTAWTDWKQVVVVAGRQLVAPKEGVPEWERIVDAVAALKGAFQHEFGHLRFTVPFNRLIETTTEDLGENSLKRSHQMTWNILEDQRMEAAVVGAVPSIAAYFKVMVANIVLGDRVTSQAWVYIAGRDYLSPALSQACRDLFAAQYGEEAAATWSRIVATYKAATTNIDLASTVVTAKTFLDDLGIDRPGEGTPGEHRSADDGWRQYEDNVEPAPSADPSAGATGSITDDADADADADTAGGAGDDDDADDADGADTAGGDGADTAGDDDADADGAGGAGADGDADDADEADGGAGGGNEADTDTDTDSPSDGVGTGESLQSLADQERREAQEEVAQHHDVQSMANDVSAAHGHGGGSQYPVYTGSKREFDGVTVKSCEDNARTIAEGFNSFLAALTPHMTGGQEDGYLDPLAYRTREVGARDYRRKMEGEVSDKLDMHLSVLVDNSGSMMGRLMDEASQAIYTLHSAADELGLPADFLLWNSHRKVYQVATNGPEPVYYATGGGTWAEDAIRDSLNHCDDSVSNHLVVIVTDGTWGSEERYAIMGTERRDNTKYLLVCIGNSTPPAGHSYADSTVTISSASQMGPVIESALHALVD